MKTRSILFVPALTLLIGTGCVSNSALEEHANKDTARYDEAMQAAKNAQSTANEAKDLAAQALKTANEANRIGTEANAKIDRAFKKAMSK